MAESRLWFLPLTLILVAQGWLTLGLFGTDQPWLGLWNEEPILSGQHPLHLYHGILGSRSFFQRGERNCYDPAFQAGYPKTPVFDNGCRPAELFLIAVGGDRPAQAYKLGLALCALLPPLLVAVGARAAGLSRAGATVAAGLTLLVWASHPCRDALEVGDVHLLLSALASLVQAGLILRFDRAPSLVVGLGLFGSGALAWFSHPLFAALLIPLTLIYYLTVGVRHPWPWHLALGLSLGGGMAVNALWLRELVAHVWIQTPPEAGTLLLPHRTFRTLWTSALWGDGLDRALGLTVVFLAIVGSIRFNQARQRAAARLLGLAVLLFLVLAVAGITWEPMGRLDSASLLAPALLFATIPAAHGMTGLTSLCALVAGGPWRGAVLVTCLVGSLAFGARAKLPGVWHRIATRQPFLLGLGAERLAVVEELRRSTRGTARILWEEQPGDRPGGRWTALLPYLIADPEGGSRAFLGGLDPGGTIDHTAACFRHQHLGGRPIGNWSDKELSEFCERYNVGWVACWSPTAVARFRVWDKASEVSSLSVDGPGVLFALNRPHSYALRGQAHLESADCEQVTLRDVEPDADGVVVLSLHYQTGLRATPGRVQLERDLDPMDPIPFVRLRLPSRATRVTLTWESR